MMWVVTAVSATHLLTSTQHRAIDVDSQCAGTQKTDQPSDHFGVESFQGFFGRCREALEPAADTAVGGQISKTAKSLQQRIPLQEAQMSQAAATHDQQTQDRPAQGHRTKVTTRDHTTLMAA